MPVTLRRYEASDFPALYRLDQACFEPGIAYSKSDLREFLHSHGAHCLVAEEGRQIVGFLLAKENAPLGHIITLDVAPARRRAGIATRLLQQTESNLIASGVRAILIQTAISNAPAVAFWQRHGYRIQAVLKRYYLNRLDAYEMRKMLAADEPANT